MSVEAPFPPGRCSIPLGKYDLLGRLAEGGMGELWLAKHPEYGVCALKRLRPELAAEPQLVRRFRQEIADAHRLKHRHIVSTFAVEEHEGEPFLAMELLEGGTLAEAANRPTAPEAIAKLMLEVTRAVERAHQLPLLHCDIKPENVLFDSEDVKTRSPRLIDFGVAQRVKAPGAKPRAKVSGYTPGWASPELVADGAIDTRSDVFSLGVLLHYLLTRGELPFGDGSNYAYRLEHESPAAPRVRGSGLERDLRHIARKAIEVEPERRYESATKLAEDIEHALADRAITGDSRVRRAFKAVRRHAYVSALVGALVPLGAHLASVPITLPEELKQNMLEQSAFGARAQARVVAIELSLFAGRVQEMADDPAVRRLVERPYIGEAPAELSAHAAGLDLVLVLDPRGVVRARWPFFSPEHFAPSSPCHKRFDFRDYFAGQASLAAKGKQGVYISRPFRSCLDGELYLGLSAPLFANGKHVGAVVGTTKARARLGAVQMNCGSAGGCFTAVLGGLDRDGPDAPVPSALHVLVEPGLKEGAGVPLDAGFSAWLCGRFPCSPRVEAQLAVPTEVPVELREDYVDPISKQRSLAAFAPVAGTGLVAVVATPVRALDEQLDRVKKRVLGFTSWRLGLAVGLFTLLAAALKLSRRGLPFRA